MIKMVQVRNTIENGFELVYASVAELTVQELQFSGLIWPWKCKAHRIDPPLHFHCSNWIG